MVLANALCAVNLAASAMVNGICCCYQMNEEDKRRTQHERILTNAVRKELEFSAKQKANLLVKAYYSNERRRNPKATTRKSATSSSSSSINSTSSSTSSSIIDKRRTNASTTGTTNGYSCCYPRDPAAAATAELEFESPESGESEQYFYPIEIGIATKSRTSNSLSSVATKKSDNRFKLKDELPELFVRLVSSSRQSLVDAYDKRKQENNTNTTKNNTNDNDNNSSYSSMPLLAPIRPVFSLLDSDDDADDDYDDDHYNNLLHRDDSNDSLHRGNNDNGDFEEIRIE